jgi:phospholipid/cholesterol/gamma-HCH transport system substrate-binding protein
METDVNYALVGLFTVVLGAALVAIVLWLGPREFKKEYDIYYAYLSESVSGLSTDAPVKYRGVVVGKVKQIALVPDNPREVHLTLYIDHGTPIKEDTVAVLSVQGLTGIAFVDLTGGSREAPPLKAKPGEEYPVIRTVPSLFSRVDTTLTQLAARLNRLADEATALLAEDNRSALSQALSDIGSVAQAVAAHRSSLEQGIDAAAGAMDNAARATAHLPDLAARTERVLDSLAAASQALARTAGGMSAFWQANEGYLQRFARQTLPDASQLVADMRRVAANVDRLVQALEQQPNALVFGRAAVAPGPGER